MSDFDRRFSDEEAREIIKRALQLQHKQSEGAPAPDGVSLSELESIASEVGVSSDLLRRAALEVETGGGKPRRSRFLGAPTDLVESVAVSGAPSEDDLSELLIALPSLTGDTGSGNAYKRSLSWRTDSMVAMQKGRSLEVTAYGSDQGVQVRIRDSMQQLAAGLFGGIIGGLGIGVGMGVGFGVGLGVLASPVFVVACVAGALSGSYLLARSLFRAVVGSRRRKLATLADEIRRFLSRSRPAGDSAGEPAGP